MNKNTDIPSPQEHVAGSHPQHEIPHDLAMLTQIWGEIQYIHESMLSTRLDINTINIRLGRIEDILYQLQDNEEH